MLKIRVVASVAALLTAVLAGGVAGATEPAPSVPVSVVSRPCPSCPPGVTYYTTSPRDERGDKPSDCCPPPAVCPPVPCCCKDAPVCVVVGAPRPCYTQQGVLAFVSMFQAAAEKGVENATIRAFNQVQVVPPCTEEPCPEDKEKK